MREAHHRNYLRRRVKALRAGENLSVGALEVLEARREEEELALGFYVVLGKDGHAQQRRVRGLGRRTTASNDVVLVDRLKTSRELVFFSS